MHISGSRSRAAIGAMILIAFDPFIGKYPSFSHVLQPATNVAFGHAIATNNGC